MTSCSFTGQINFSKKRFTLSPIAFRMANILWSFGYSECNRVKGKTLAKSFLKELPCIEKRDKFENSKVASLEPGHVAQSVGHLTRKSEVLGSIPGLAPYFRFSFC